MNIFTLTSYKPYKNMGGCLTEQGQVAKCYALILTTLSRNVEQIKLFDTSFAVSANAQDIKRK